MTKDEALALPWPEDSEVEHVYLSQGRDRPRFTKHKTLGWVRPGVTSILSPWDKGAIIKWSVDVEREACLEAASKVYGEIVDKGKAYPVEVFQGRLEANLGAARAYRRKLEKAGDIGTAAHDMVRWRIQKEMGLDAGFEPTIPDESTIAVMAWEDHWKAAGLVPIRTEQHVWSDAHEYSGTVDLFALREGKLGIVDLKTGKGIYSSHHLQVAAYAGAAEELLGVKIEWAELWRLPKTLEDVRFEAARLGEYRVWNGAGFTARSRTRQELLDGFLGLVKPWRLTIDPTPQGGLTDERETSRER